MVSHWCPLVANEETNYWYEADGVSAENCHCGCHGWSPTIFKEFQDVPIVFPGDCAGFRDEKAKFSPFWCQLPSFSILRRNMKGCICMTLVTLNAFQFSSLADENCWRKFKYTVSSWVGLHEQLENWLTCEYCTVRRASAISKLYTATNDEISAAKRSWALKPGGSLDSG